MKMTTKGRFAVISMIDLSLYGADGPVRLCDISKRQNISLAYLEQIFRQLRISDLVVSSRGPGGGYRLARAENEITAGDIIVAVEGKFDLTKCHGDGTCRGGAECLTHALWVDLNKCMADFLFSQTLADIKSRYANTGHVAPPAPVNPIRGAAAGNR